MMFGTKVLDSNQERVKEILKVRNITTEEKYLGLPTPEGGMKKEKLTTLKERLT
jgi:hypothetical protein